MLEGVLEDDYELALGALANKGVRRAEATMNVDNHYLRGLYRFSGRFRWFCATWLPYAPSWKLHVDVMRASSVF
jgi:hypothetical protein